VGDAAGHTSTTHQVQDPLRVVGVDKKIPEKDMCGSKKEQRSRCRSFFKQEFSEGETLGLLESLKQEEEN